MSKKHLILLLSCFCFATGASAESLTATTPATELAVPAASVQTAQALSNTLLVETFLTNEWKKESLEKLLGQSHMSFDGYESYGEGIRVRWDENNRAYGILVDSSYSGEVIKGMTGKTTRTDLTRILGTPRFVDPSNELVGYQYEHYYLFATFTQERLNGISIYRRDQTDDTKALLDIAKNLGKYGDQLSSPATSASFSIFGAWGAPDYTHHLHGIGTFAWEYPARGIAYDGLEADATLTIYSNFSLRNELSAIKNEKNVIFSDEDSLFLEEKNRLAWEKALIQAAKKEGILSPDKQAIALIDSDGLYYTANIRFYRPDYTPLAQLYPGYFIDDVIWLDGNWALYSTMEGIGVFNWQTKEHQVLLSPTEGTEHPIDFYDVEGVRVDTKSKTILIDLAGENQEPYKLTYRITGNQLQFQ